MTFFPWWDFMSIAYNKFKDSLIKARVTKFIIRYIKDVESKKIEDLISENNKYDINEYNDEILIGRWLKDPSNLNEIKEFRKNITPELLSIMNALTRSSIEKYAKNQNFKGKYPANTMTKKYIDLISKFKMKFDPDSKVLENPIEINRILRNEYIHGERRENDRLNTEKSHDKILGQRVHISSIHSYPQINFIRKKASIEFIRVCDLLEFESIRSRFNSLNIYFSEFLMWRINNVIKKIDSILS